MITKADLVRFFDSVLALSIGGMSFSFLEIDGGLDAINIFSCMALLSAVLVLGISDVLGGKFLRVFNGLITMMTSVMSLIATQFIFLTSDQGISIFDDPKYAAVQFYHSGVIIFFAMCFCLCRLVMQIWSRRYFSEKHLLNISLNWQYSTAGILMLCAVMVVDQFLPVNEVVLQNIVICTLFGIFYEILCFIIWLCRKMRY